MALPWTDETSELSNKKQSFWHGCLRSIFFHESCPAEFSKFGFVLSHHQPHFVIAKEGICSLWFSMRPKQTNKIIVVFMLTRELTL